MKRLYITLAILLVLLVAAFVWWSYGTSAVNSKDKTAKIFVIKNGQGVRAIAKDLKDQGLIKDQVAFFLLTKQLGLDSKVQAGSFRLNPSMNSKEIANALTHGTMDIWITIPEGQRAGEIADVLEKNMPNYEASWEAKLEENEGYLFPDTYLFPQEATIDTIIKTMRDNFDAKYSQLDSGNSKLSKAEIVILASLIEREARHAEDRPMVASVIFNRLNEGMKLDIDATLQYILGYQKDQKRWWKEGLTNQNKQLNSPFNTYKVAGLPPGPISNPGIASLKAALNPSDTPYFYYITDANGTNRYAKTLEEHEANIEKYGL
jgi:UPF0755 protein